MLLIIVAFLGVPLVLTSTFRAVLIPFLILALAALGVNILVGYCGLSLGGHGSGRVCRLNKLRPCARGLPLLVSPLVGGSCMTLVGIVFSATRHWRVKGLYLAVATLAGASSSAAGLSCASKWPPTARLPGTALQRPDPECLCPRIQTPLQSGVFCLAVAGRAVLGQESGALAPSIPRVDGHSRHGRDAAAVIGIRPMYAKLSAFAVSSFIIGVAGALWAFVHLG